MKKNFRLQKVLEYRERLVEIEKNKLADLNAKLAMAIKKLEETEQNIEKQITDRETAENIYRSMYDKYIKRLTTEKASIGRVKKQVELNIEIQKKKVMDAINRHKVMLKLKEKHVENYRMYLDKEEMKMIDELAVTRSARNED